MNDSVKKVFRIIYRVYSIFSVCLVSILIIAALIACINFGEITVFAIEKTLDSYDTEITKIVSDYFTEEAIELKSIKIVNKDGVQALQVDLASDRIDLSSINIDDFQDKTNEEIIAELGITPDQLPPQIISLIKSTKLALDINILNEKNAPAFNRLITPAQIAEFLK